jgi:hypothetical protein
MTGEHCELLLFESPRDSTEMGVTNPALTCRWAARRVTSLELLSAIATDGPETGCRGRREMSHPWISGATLPDMHPASVS